MTYSTPSSSIAATKSAGADQNAINSTTSAGSDSITPSEKRRLAALKGWERKRELEKSGGLSKKMRITPPRSERAAKTAAVAAITAPQQSISKSTPKREQKGWETRKKKMATAVPSPVGSSATSTTTKSLTHSEAAKLGWERIKKKKALEEAKAKAATASKKKTSAKTTGLSHSEAAKLGWERIREKKKQVSAAAAAAAKGGASSKKKKTGLSHSEAAKLGWQRKWEADKANAEEDEDDDHFKVRSKSSKKGWETRKKKMLSGAKVEDKVDVKDKLFVVRSKSSKKGWETRRKLTGATVKEEVKDMDEWKQRSKASKKGWETRRIQGTADAGGKTKSLTHSEAAKLGWERIRESEEAGVPYVSTKKKRKTPESDEKPRKKPYNAASRSEAAKMAWQKEKEKKMLMAGTATAPSGRSYYQQDSSVATHTYTAERVEWEIRQKMLAAANAEEDSSSEEESDEESSEEEDSSDEELEEVEVEHQTEERTAAEISRDEAANLLLAMFGASAPEAPAAKAEDTSVADTSHEASIVEALQELACAKSEDTSMSVENYGEGVNQEVVEEEPEVEKTSMRGRKRKPTAKGSGYTAAKRDWDNKKHEQEFASKVKAPSAQASTAVKSTPKSPTKSGGSKAASKSSTGASEDKISKKRSQTAKNGWQKRKSEVIKKSNLDPQETEKINAAIAVVKKATGKTAGKEMPLPRGVTVRPSGKWQAQLYYAGKSRYIGVFDNREDACYAYEVAREILILSKDPKDDEVEANINLARKAAFAGVRK